MKKIILIALLIASANAGYREVCIEGVNPYGVEKMVDICIMIPSEKIDASTKHKMLRVYSVTDIESLSTWVGKEKSLEEFSKIINVKNIYYSKISFYKNK